MVGVLLFGMGVMCAIEGWSASNAFYWATVTLMTVGYGGESCIERMKGERYD